MANFGTQEWCDWRNSIMDRHDVEWFVDGSGVCRLADRQGFNAKRTRDIEQLRERERRDWINAQRRGDAQVTRAA